MIGSYLLIQFRQLFLRVRQVLVSFFYRIPSVFYSCPSIGQPSILKRICVLHAPRSRGDCAILQVVILCKSLAIRYGSSSVPCEHCLQVAFHSFQWTVFTFEELPDFRRSMLGYSG